MSTLLSSIPGRARAASPAVALVTMILVFYVVPTLDGHTVDSYAAYTAMQTFAAYGLLALALGLTMIIGEFDLSALGMYALGGMVAVKTGADSAVLGIAVALAVGCVSGLIQGGIIARLGLSSMAVTLGGYIILLGTSSALGSDKTVAFPDVSVGITLDKPIAEILSLRSIIVLVAFAVLGLVMAYTRLGRDVRALGGDRRAARVAGVRVDGVLLAVFAASGMLAALGGALSSYSLASALPNPGFSPLIFGATAALIGGVGLAGGQGGAAGIAAGALALSLLQATFGLLASPSWLPDVVTGSLLVVAAAMTAPQLAARWHLLRVRLRPATARR
jgi:ribose/xylose/arabinose/galactoside ABC-type transport system permease subunit